MAKNIRLIRPRVVTGDGVGLVSHAGIGWIAETADLSGLTAGLSLAMTRLPQRRHDPGRTLAHMVLAIADGATCLSDLAGIRAQRAMFGPVASDPTVWRTFDQVGPGELRQIAVARAAARAQVWAAGAGPAGDRLIIDFDATLLPTRTNKQDAAPTYKRTFGHHPLLAMIVETDEMLTGLMRAGNAGSNTAADHVTVLADALAQLPGEWQTGHQPGDHPDLVKHPILIRADGAGASHWFAEACVERNLEFTFGYQIDNRVRDGVIGIPTGCWHPAVDSDGRNRDGAQIIELTTLVNMDGWPTGTRLIVRRERPHPGAQPVAVRHDRRVPSYRVHHHLDGCQRAQARTPSTPTRFGRERDPRHQSNRPIEFAVR